MSANQDAARVVVIGGGIAGCSVAYHLASLGVSEVLLLERSTLSSGTTWHSTGNMETYREDPLIFQMVQYGAALYPQLAAQTDRDIGWRTVGRVMYTDREDRWARWRALPELGRARGIEIGLLDPQALARRLPIIATDGLIGGLWIPSDARVNATDAVFAFAAAAKARGMRIRNETAATAIVTRDGRVCGIATTTGMIDCEAVVVAAGLWSREILATCGYNAPLYALEHQYLITEPQGIERNLPLFLSYDDQLYGREEVGGLMIGSLDDHAVPLAAEELPQNFSFALLNERWEQFEPYLSTAMRRFPSLRNADVKMLLNGPESFTPDGQMLLGPVPGASGVYACCGFNSNGIALSPAAGRFIAEWIVEGAPSADVTNLDIRRFSAIQGDTRYLRARVSEIPGHHCRMHRTDKDYSTARNVRCSPLHSALAACGARFGSVNGWERPLWIAASADDDAWLAAIAGEVESADRAVLIVDRSADVKVLVEGDPHALDSLSRAPGNWPLTTWLRPLAGSHAQIEGLAQVLPWPHGLLLSTGPEQETRVLEWLRTVGAAAGLRGTDQTNRFAALEMIGPLAGVLIARLTGTAMQPAECHRAVTLGEATVQVHSSADGMSCRLTLPREAAMEVWKRLQSAGRDLGARIGGYFAQEAIRIRLGTPAFGREATPARQVAEIAADAPAPISGDPATAPPKTHRGRRLAAFWSALEPMGFGWGEVILEGDRAVGELTSRVRLPGWARCLAVGLLDPEAMRSQRLTVVVDGERWRLEPRRTAWSEGR